jgi:SAM-dependent methyltransferase
LPATRPSPAKLPSRPRLRPLKAVPGPGFLAWFDALYARHTADLRFPEIRKALQALSTVYVQRRDRLAQGHALGTAGKRAAFALFYTPLHALLVQALAGALPTQRPTELLDLGCGTGAAGLGWALHDRQEAGPGAAPLRLRGIDVNAYAVQEARWNWHQLSLQEQVSKGDLGQLTVGRDQSVVLAYVLNELSAPLRAQWLGRLLEGPNAPAQVLIVEPIAGRVAPWFAEWEARFTAVGGRADAWQVEMQMPERLALLDKAAGLHHSTFRVRSLFLNRRNCPAST